MKTLIVLALVASFCFAVYAATLPQIRVDCGSLAGEGIVYLKIGEDGYKRRFACGLDA